MKARYPAMNRRAIVGRPLRDFSDLRRDVRSNPCTEGPCAWRFGLGGDAEIPC